MKLKFLILFCLLSTVSFAQNCKLPNSKELTTRYNDAAALMQQNKELGLKYLLEIVKANPNYYPAAMLVGKYYLDKAKDAQLRFQHKLAKEYSQTALNYLGLSFTNCEFYDSSRAAFFLGECFYINRKFDRSQKYFEKFLSSPNAAPSHLAWANKRMQMIDEYFDIINNPVKYNPRILHDISTADDEYLPLLSHDGSILIYTRRYQRYQKQNNEYVEELMLSQLECVENGVEKFSRGVKLSKPFNTGKLQGGASLTMDNKILYITICDHDNCDIYYSQNEDGNWRPLIKLPNTVNTEFFDGQPAIDATGNVLYFSSNRPGGYGGYDLYKIVRKHPDSLWSAPINLGPEINTEYDEKTPYIHCDGKTLYFSSNGHGGVGGFDIFYSRLQNNKRFSEPQNIGYPINSESDEVAYVVSADGKRLYFSTMLLSGEGGWDIYCSDLYPEASPSQVLLIKGKIVDDNGNPIAGVDVDLTGLTSHETSHAVTDSKTGTYAVSTPVDKSEDYMLTVKKKGFFYNVQFFQPDSAEYIPPTIENMKLDKIQTDVPYTLENVNFTYNSAKLTEISKAYLNQLALFLKEYPQYNAEIRGHTDGTGTEEENMLLSERRCRTVINFLVSSEVDAKRLSYKAFGKTAPMATNATSEGRALNRRVEVVLSMSKK